MRASACVCVRRRKRSEKEIERPEPPRRRCNRKNIVGERAGARGSAVKIAKNGPIIVLVVDGGRCATRRCAARRGAVCALARFLSRSSSSMSLTYRRVPVLGGAEARAVLLRFWRRSCVLAYEYARANLERGLYGERCGETMPSFIVTFRARAASIASIRPARRALPYRAIPPLRGASLRACEPRVPSFTRASRR